MKLSGAINKHKEIAYYSSLPIAFDGFLECDGLCDGPYALYCVDKRPAEPKRGYVPSYNFEILAYGSKVGYISLRVGYTKSLYYSGQIGYAVDAPQRGKGYAGVACRLLIPLMRAHGMSEIIITNNIDNTASRKVCEKLGARLLRAVKLPRSHELYKAGDRSKNIFLWEI